MKVKLSNKKTGRTVVIGKKPPTKPNGRKKYA